MKKLLPILFVALTLTSCLDSDDNEQQTTTQWTYANCFNYVVDNSDGSTNVTLQPKYTLTVITTNGGDSKVKISMANVRLGDDLTMTSFDLPEMELNVNPDPTKPRTAEARDVVPSNSIASNVIFDYVRLKVLPRVITSSQQYVQSFVYKLEFSVNGRYAVSVIPTRSLLYGTTTSISDNGTSYTGVEPMYAITVEPENMLATIDITGARFVEQMPSMNMTFPKVPCSVADGKLMLDADELVPTISGVEYPGYPISELAATIDPCTSGSLDFVCTIERLGAYKVHVDLTDLPENGTAAVQ